MLTNFPKKGTVAELGVDKGYFSEKILTTTEPKELYLIDIWDSGRYSEEKMMEVEQKFENCNEVSIVRERSEIALENFENNFFDWIYIDTTHTYEQTLKELNISQKKIKEDGIIAGHDYCVGNISKGLPYGVISAVHEFCIQENFEMIHLSLETHGRRSFALKKIAS